MRKEIEYNNPMKRYLLIIVCALCIPFGVQAQDFASTSMQESGSAYVPPVTPVGATTAYQYGVTVSDGENPSQSTSQHISGRKNFDTFDEVNVSNQSPIGEVYALLAWCALCAVLIVAARYMHRRKSR